MSQQATTDFQRFAQKARAELAQATTPVDQLCCVVLLAVAELEIKRKNAPSVQRPAPGRNGRTAQRA